MLEDKSYQGLVAQSKKAEDANGANALTFKGGSVMGCVGEVTSSAYNVYANYASTPSVVTGSTSAAASLYSYSEVDGQLESSVAGSTKSKSDKSTTKKYAMSAEQKVAFEEAGRFLNPLSNYAVDSHEHVTNGVIKNQTADVNAMVKSGKYRDAT